MRSYDLEEMGSPKLRARAIFEPSIQQQSQNVVTVVCDGSGKRCLVGGVRSVDIGAVFQEKNGEASIVSSGGVNQRCHTINTTRIDACTKIEKVLQNKRV